MKKIVFVLISLIITVACNSTKENENLDSNKGKLFIIGGGKKSTELLRKMTRVAELNSSGYTVVLPMSSSIPDTSGYWIKQDLKKINVSNVHVFNLQSKAKMTKMKLDSVKNASLIYITGGNQNTFMKIAGNTPLVPAIRKAYEKGAVIAGTSAGAALMSKKMITGNEFKHPEYTGDFKTIEANNIEIKNGLGLLKNAIIDQHFIQRMRMNRLLSACLENPDQTGIGIDESTAILVEGNNATVYGEGQVIVIRNTQMKSRVKNGLLGGNNLNLSVYLPGENFKIKRN
jgi:cyanophycinase